jgi:flagellar basal-body rod protein FlgG
MVNMITALRAFETNQKVIQAVDSTLDRVINEVGRV